MARKAASKKTAKQSKPAKSSGKGGKRKAETDYESMTVQDLKKLCSEKGINAKGKKADLIKSLKQGDDGPPKKVAKLKKQDTLQKAAAALLATGTGKRKTFKPDKQCTLASNKNCQVYQDYDCMLNQTDISQNTNKNKYYIIQVLTSAGNYYAWNRWGRVGDPPGCFHGQKLHGPFKQPEQAVKSFEGKYWDKTRTKWADRDNFVAVKGKYTLIEMGEEEDEEPVKISMAEGKLAVTAACKLDKQTQGLVKFIFDTDMFNKAMIQLSFDVKKMPLGKLSKVQIAKGFEILGEIKSAINKNQHSKFSELSGKFYTAIPHDFGWKKPTVINSETEVRQKMDNLLVLGDIELAQALQKNPNIKKIKAGDLPPHPLDASYDLLDCDLNLIPEGSAEFKTIQHYMNATRGYCIKKIRNIWKMNRRAEETRFKKYDKMSNHRLLWHGTNVAVCAAILKEGLRIMPHAGGRVGRGLYFASENSKSAGYVRSVDKVGVMFLNQVALGKEKTITQDDSSLTKAPNGFDCVVARGRTEPDPKSDSWLQLEGTRVAVPQGKPVQQNKYNASSFSQSEYLVYREDQVRMRYLLQLEWSY